MATMDDTCPPTCTRSVRGAWTRRGVCRS